MMKDSALLCLPTQAQRVYAAPPRHGSADEDAEEEEHEIAAIAVHGNAVLVAQGSQVCVLASELFCCEMQIVRRACAGSFSLSFHCEVIFKAAKPQSFSKLRRTTATTTMLQHAANCVSAQ